MRKKFEYTVKEIVEDIVVRRCVDATGWGFYGSRKHTEKQITYILHTEVKKDAFPALDDEQLTVKVENGIVHLKFSRFVRFTGPGGQTPGGRVARSPPYQKWEHLESAEYALADPKSMQKLDAFLERVRTASPHIQTSTE